MICNKCGCKIDTEAKFCARCGADLRQEGATLNAEDCCDNPPPYHTPRPDATADSKNVIIAFVFAIAGVVLPFFMNFDSYWYISTIGLMLKTGGFALSLTALIIVSKMPKPRRGLALAAFILSIIGMVISGIAMLAASNSLMRDLIGYRSIFD
ncbi:MAG: zinc-ribbon domain-containing protein [Firmicutes bacterium]|nr:zinc-ribbon domain-containing protein [Bacillota bacterium]